MALSAKDVRQAAKLSKLALTEQEEAASLAELNDIFAMIERMRAVDTEGVEPLMHTTEEPCRLREDEPVSISAQKRDACLALAPQVVNGMFVVPKVVE